MSILSRQIAASTADVTERGWSLEVSPEKVEPIPGASAPAVIQAHGPVDTLPARLADGVDGEGKRAVLEIEAVFDQQQGRYVLRRLAVTAAGGSEVTGTLLRQIAPLSLMRWIVPRTFTMPLATFSASVANFVTPEGRVPQDSGGDSSASLKDAATVYRLAEVVREPPAKAVAEALGLQTRTATNWIVRARKQGLLP